ncbi:RNA-directed DNA polymerase, eukaryota, reverse transcriptase zinc-binding domain protein [Tanacetum coccineum]
MWGKLGIKDIVSDDNNMFFFKFKHEDGMNIVLEWSPWLVNGKHLVVQKWDPDVNIVKSKPKSNIGFARVLVEIDAAKGYLDKIEIIYIDAGKNVKRRNFVDVEYDWKPLSQEGNGNKRSYDKNSKMVYRPKEKSNNVDVDDDEEDVIEVNDMATSNLVADDINGLDDHVLNA